MSASIFAVGLVISVTVFISIIIVVIKANKRARSIELATRRRTRLSRYEDQDPANQQPRRTIESECTTNASIYDDMDYEIAKVAIIATNKNIAYDNLAIEKTGSNIKEHEYAQIH